MSLATMLKVKRRFNRIYWTDLRSCWKRDKPFGDSDRRSVTLTIPSANSPAPRALNQSSLVMLTNDSLAG